ncbi:MAG TPA: heavy metal translocating P-type ATPase metal-binding domain-containing protein, partial [Tepidisphaeraceae bacterium]|nr:heavy metal translocating P-type ATPase metal-binding domain-containing protein [Tepidisphaeraceae bacterium]
MSLITRTFSTPTDKQFDCAHCGLPVPVGLIEKGDANQFCCAGCRAVYETITSCGLADYYKLRELAGETGQASPASATNRKYDSFDTEAFEKLYVTHHGSLKQTEFVLEGLTCGACVWLIEKVPSVLNGVIETRLSLREARLRVTWDPQAVSLSRIASLLDRFGYTPHVAKSVTKRELVQRAERSMVIDIAVAFALMGNLMLISAALYAGWLGTMDESMTRFLRYCAMVLGTISLAVPGRCFFVNAYRAIRNRVANLDVPIALALVAGGCAGIANTILNRGESYFDSLSMLILLLLAGRYLQYRQQRRADAAVELLFNLVPSTVHVMRDGLIVDLPGEALEQGDLVEVRTGELIPGDGHVASGSTSIDQALLTGESRAVPVKEGDSVFAGSMNQLSVIQVRINAVGSDTRVGRLMELVERGTSEKPNAMRFADGIGRWFVPGVCIASLVTFLFWVRSDLSSAIDNSISMLIVTCPCVLGLATPLTMAVSIGQLARRNVLVKSAAALERLAGIKTIVFDKTGTLTHSDLQVVSFTGIALYQPLIAEVERHFTHPIAKAVVEAYGNEHCTMPLDSISACGNQGVRARANGMTVLIGSEKLLRDHAVKSIPLDDHGDCRTRIHASIDGAWVAMIAFAERVREDA